MTDETTEKTIRVALITGANGAIGQAIARQMAALPKYEVVLVGRNEQRMVETTEAVQVATGNNRVRYELADLSRQADVLGLAGRWLGPLHVLVNNAAASPRRRLWFHQPPSNIPHLPRDRSTAAPQPSGRPSSQKRYRPQPSSHPAPDGQQRRAAAG